MVEIVDYTKFKAICFFEKLYCFVIITKLIFRFFMGNCMKYSYRLIVLLIFVCFGQYTQCMQPRYVAQVHQDACQQCCRLGCLTLGVSVISYIVLLCASDCLLPEENNNASIIFMYPRVERKMQ